MFKFNKAIHLLLLLLLFFIWGCEKEEHTQPTDFNLFFEIDDTPVMEGKLTIESIFISLGSIEIDGRREVGEDVFMIRDFGEREIFQLTRYLPATPVNFNLPQGIYNPLYFFLNFSPDNEEAELDDEFDEWIEDMQHGEKEIEELQEDLGDIIEDYLDGVMPCIMMKAKYQRNDIYYNVVFALNDPLLFRVKGMNEEGGNQVTLRKDRINNGIILLDPSYWFSVISPSIMESAFIGVIDDDEKYIFLHKKVNSQLFTTVYNRLAESAVLYINE